MSNEIDITVSTITHEDTCGFLSPREKNWGKQVHVKLRFIIVLLVLRRKCDEPFSPVISYRRKLEQVTVLKGSRFVNGECESEIMSVPMENYRGIP